MVDLIIQENGPAVVKTTEHLENRPGNSGSDEPFSEAGGDMGFDGLPRMSLVDGDRIPIETTVAFGEALRWAHVPGFVLFVSLIGFALGSSFPPEESMKH